MSILKSEFDVFLDTNDMLFSRQEYNRLSRRLQEICEASSRKPLRESESDAIHCVLNILLRKLRHTDSIRRIRFNQQQNESIKITLIKLQTTFQVKSRLNIVASVERFLTHHRAGWLID